MPPLLLQLIFDRVKKSRVPFFVKPITKAVADKVLSEFVNPNIKRLLDFIETSLEGKKWFLGDQLSGADIQMSFPLETIVASGLIDDHYPCLLYTSDAADDLLCVDLGGRRIIKKND